MTPLKGSRILTVCLSCLSLLAGAQDSHYWTQQYGTKSMLLSGSVIGGVEDLGAVFYNPARLAVIQNPAFLLSANVYEYTNLSISDAFGTARNASRSSFKGVPTLAAGTFNIKRLPKHKFAYAILSRQNGDFDFSFRDEVHKDVFSGLPGNELFGGEVSLKGASSEQWFSLAWATSVSKKLSIGLTTNFSVSKQEKSNVINLQAMSTAKEVGVYRYNRNFDYSQTGLLWKAAMAYDAGPWKLGLTVTTPTLRIGGTGNFSMEEFYSTIPGLGTRPEAYTSSYQTGLKATLKSPLSVGVGITRMIGKSKIHLSTEWYQSLSKYAVMTAQDFPTQSDSTIMNGFYLTDEARSVWNTGIGAEIYINEHISGFASFSTDYSAAQSNLVRFADRTSEVSNSTWNADFYNAGGGFVLDFKWADLTLGATHTGGTQQIPRPVNFPEKPGDKIFGVDDTADAKWDRWRFVFSFSFPFLSEYAKKLSEK